MGTLRERLKEQQGRHQGGNKWIGTARNLALRRLWLHPRGVPPSGKTKPPPPRGQGLGQARLQGFRGRRRTGHPQHQGRALKRLRQWARDGAAEELDLDGTIRAIRRTGLAPNTSRPPAREPGPPPRNAVEGPASFSMWAARWTNHIPRGLEELFLGCQNPSSSIWSTTTSTTAFTSLSGATKPQALDRADFPNPPRSMNT